MKTRRTIHWALLAALVLVPEVRGDWLVTREGQRIETRGAWEVRGRMIVFTAPAGTLSSIRLSEIDLDASRRLSEAAQRAAEEAAAAAEPAEDGPREPVMTLTDRDVGRAELGAVGPEALVERLRNAHRLGDARLAISLVNWQDAAPAYRSFLENELRWLMGRRLRDVQLIEVEPGENLEQVQDGVAYEPNVDVTHRLEIDLVPDADDDRLVLSLYVGTRLGAYHIAAARRVDD